jgi:prophage maintenance system killer protein
MSLIHRQRRSDELRFLSVEEVTRIYKTLVADFATTPDPLSPAGIRDQGLLESAVARQLTGLGPTLKYPHPIMNAASLTFGLCNDHPFLNGNKRTALVSMLAHLDKNEYCLPGVSQSDLYKLMLSIADHTLAGKPDPRKKGDSASRCTADEEVQAIYDFIRKRAQRIESGERVVTYRQLRRILVRFGFSMENVGDNSADIVRYEERATGLIGRHWMMQRIVVERIGYHDEGSEVSKRDVALARKSCGLSEHDGVDSRAFYSFDATIDEFVNKYRRVLRNLARV